ncbi:hypothetical protein HPG69_010607 [Diceros bicornis minor]|uniref:Uncharacterized protein n=1 Tax=Diceros bicornis minor TaxID=77932 RepID=A0A7J7ELF1_DICBM|nr:hypothetical protein HPG69_010607 [Diceros bicornis minor]
MQGYLDHKWKEPRSLTNRGEETKRSPAVQPAGSAVRDIHSIVDHRGELPQAAHQTAARSTVTASSGTFQGLLLIEKAQDKALTLLEVEVEKGWAGAGPQLLSSKVTVSSRSKLQKMCDQPRCNPCCQPKPQCCIQPKPQCCIQPTCCCLEPKPESMCLNKEAEPTPPQTQNKGSQTQQQPQSPKQGPRPVTRSKSNGQRWELTVGSSNPTAMEWKPEEDVKEANRARQTDQPGSPDRKNQPLCPFLVSSPFLALLPPGAADGHKSRMRSGGQVQEPMEEDSCKEESLNK